MLSHGQKILFVVSVSILAAFSLVILIFGREPALPKQDIGLTMWGVKDTAEQMQPLLDAFTESYRQLEGYQNITIRVKYTELPEEQYETILLSALAEGRGPDLFYIHNTWLPRYLNKLAPLPTGIMTVDDYRKIFVPVAASDFIIDNLIYAFPLYVDTLAVYFNASHFQDARTLLPRPQSTWEGLKADAPLLAIATNPEELERGGIALGTAETVHYAPDIFTLLLLQYGGDVCDSSCDTITLNSTVSGENPAQNALTTYLSFKYPDSETGGWNDSIVENDDDLSNDIDAFVKEKVSAIIGYQEIYPDLMKRARDENITVQVAEIPQVEDPSLTESRDALASYYAPAVSAKSPNQLLAWQLLGFVSTTDSLSKYHSATGRPSARLDLIPLHQTEPQTGIFATQAKYAKSVHVYDIAEYRENVKDMLEDAEDHTMPLTEALKDLSEALTNHLQMKRFLDSIPPATAPVSG